VAVVREGESPCQVEDQNGSDLELETGFTRPIKSNSRTTRSCGGPCIEIESPPIREGGTSFVSTTG
jgi:hypothetical protein